jgi:hypothetical protein
LESKKIMHAVSPDPVVRCPEISPNKFSVVLCPRKNVLWPCPRIRPTKKSPRKSAAKKCCVPEIRPRKSAVSPRSGREKFASGREGVAKLATFWASSLSRTTTLGYSFRGCFLASMPDSFVRVLRKPKLKAIRHFRVYTNSNLQAFSEKCQKNAPVGAGTVFLFYAI